MATGTTTRAAAHQQKLEEHLAVILQRLDMQKADFDQRSAEQERLAQERHIQLQQQLQTEVAGVSIGLQQQNDKLEGQRACYEEQNRLQQMQHAEVNRQMQEFIDVQRQQLNSVDHRLVQAEERLKTFNDEVEGLREAHQGDIERLQERQHSTENRLATEVQREVSEVCDRIVKELETQQNLRLEELRQEMLRTVEKLPSPTTTNSSLLRPDAPPFNSLSTEATATATTAACAGEGGTGATSTKAVQRAPPYDGRSAWEAYRTQFEMLARVNNWNEVERATFLAVSLKGPALTVLTNIPRDNLYNYSALVTALEARFGSSHQAELHRIKLKNRTRKRDESLAELAEEVERLARLAYPDAPPEMLELLAKDQFIDAIVDGEARLRLRQSRPKGLREALRTALELEAFQLASQHRAKPVRGAAIEDMKEEPAMIQDVKQVSCEEIKQCMQECLENCFSRQQPYQTRQRGPPGGGPRRGRGIKGNCWSCGQPGHMQQDCPERDKQPSSSARSPASQSGNDK
jgi:hypothetical protein